MAVAAKKATKVKKAPKAAVKKIKLVEVTGYDLFFQLIYMSAIAAAGIERRKIFELAAALPRHTASYFRRIHLLSQKLGYDYSESTKLVGLKVKSTAMRSLLLRFSEALSSGQPEAVFLAEEAEFQTNAYEKEYERDLEALKKWTDGYAALIISSALIIIVNLISVMIYPIDSGTIGTLVLVSLATASGGAWILWRTGPSDKRAEFSEVGPPKQRLARTAAFAGIGGVIGIGLPMGMLGVDLGIVLITSGVFLLPAGILSSLSGRDVEKVDKEIGHFLRGLGSFASSTGTTMGESLVRVDVTPFPALEPDLMRLRARMKASISPTLCWKRFSDETGSRLILEATQIFNDAIGLGGAADTVGNFAARYAALTNTLRDRRLVVSSTFTTLTIVMHAVLSALMMVILEVIRNFTLVIEASMAAASAAVESSSVPLPTFGSPELGLLQVASIGMIIALAFINAIAIVVTDGDHMIKITLYLGILLIVSGITMIVVPPFVANMVSI